MASPSHSWLRLEGKSTTFILQMEDSGLAVVYWGEKLRDADPEMISMLRMRIAAQGTADIELPITLCPTRGAGFSGSDGIQVHRGGTAWDFQPQTMEIVSQSDVGAVVQLLDPINHIVMEHVLTIDTESDVIKFITKVINRSAQPLNVNWCNAATLPLPSSINQITGFHGRWANEFQTHSVDSFPGAYVRENMRGRTSHDCFPGILAHNKNTTELAGATYGFHLGWSGNHRLVSEKLSDGRTFVQMGEKLLPGEIILNENAEYQSPAMYASFSADGFSALSQNFHHYVRTQLLRESLRNKPRPIHYNTWEAVYFDHDIDTLKQLAGKAAEVGAERYVLDDGWFSGRRNDRAGLGDWYVDEGIYPGGLTPLIDHVKSLGMEFGLWFEPEMVNPDSNLFRAHPDWVLSAKTSDQIPFRNQFVLDLSRSEVRAYLFERIDSLLTEYDISYIKWDMNRDINHPGSNGVPSVHRQTNAVYQLIKTLREKHPTVEIESCSSGGGRADYGMLEHTDRIWTSDSNDALDRLNIQRGLSFFFPSAVMGAHVGPRDCHTTRRMLSMGLRTATAFFGHMGMEIDLNELTDLEHKTLKTAIALHKSHRTLLHSGNLVRLESKSHAHAFGIISQDKSKALFSYTQTTTRAETTPEIFYFQGLDVDTLYQINLILPLDFRTETIGTIDHFAGNAFSGDMLMKVGLQLPHIKPATAIVFELAKA